MRRGHKYTHDEAAMTKSNGQSGRSTEQQILDEVRSGCSAIDSRLGSLHQDNLQAGVRLDRLIEAVNGDWRDHEARLRAVEAKLGLR